MKRVAVLSLAAALLVCSPLGGSARADDVDVAELARLVERAPHDPSTLSRLRAVDSVDGRVIDMDALLEGATGGELAQRLAALEIVTTAQIDPAGARSEAADILDDRRFRKSDSPKPLKGAMEWLNERTAGIREALADFVRVFPGGLVVFWAVIALLIAVAAMVLAGRLATRRQVAARTHLGPEESREDPKDLLRAAEAAEKGGDLQTSLRLRFKAGLLRLAERGVLPGSSSLTSEEISELLGSKTFDRLAATFDRVVYGRRPAAANDVEEAKSGWRSVETEARR